MLNLSSARAGKPLQIAGYTLLATAFLVRGWIPILLLVIIALVVEHRKTKASEAF